MNPGLISIIIPSFNRAHLLSHAIESVLNQTDPLWELLVVDDGSTDETKEVVNKYAEDPRIIYKFKEHSGVSATRNMGADLATGDYFIFLDSDDSFTPDLLEKLRIEKFENYDLICWNVLKDINGKKMVWKPHPLGGLYNNIQATFLSGSICYKRKIFFSAGSFDPNLTFGENYELGIRISQLPGIKIAYIDRIFLQYKIITHNRESNSLSNRLTSYIYQFKKHQSLYKKNKKAKAEMHYLIGFVLERSNKKRAAFKHYKNSWKSNPWRLKPILKIIYFKIFR